MDHRINVTMNQDQKTRRSTIEAEFHKLINLELKLSLKERFCKQIGYSTLRLLLLLVIVSLWRVQHGDSHI